MQDAGQDFYISFHYTVEDVRPCVNGFRSSGQREAGKESGATRLQFPRVMERGEFTEGTEVEPFKPIHTLTFNCGFLVFHLLFQYGH